MKLKTREIRKEYAYTDEEARERAAQAIRDSALFINALVDDE